MTYTSIRHWIFIVLCTAAVVMCVFGTESNAMSGSGTADDPYVITSASDISAMHDYLGA